jgi:hypothetical protein
MMETQSLGKVGNRLPGAIELVTAAKFTVSDRWHGEVL